MSTLCFAGLQNFSLITAVLGWEHVIDYIFTEVLLESLIVNFTNFTQENGSQWVQGCDIWQPAFTTPLLLFVKISICE